MKFVYAIPAIGAQKPNLLVSGVCVCKMLIYLSLCLHYQRKKKLSVCLQ